MDLGNAEDYGNDASVEAMWAVKAFDHATTYFNIISAVDPQYLKLTPHDNQIYEEFVKTFPDMKLEVIDIEELKSDSAKEKWRPWCNQFEKVVEDFNMGTLLRIDCKKEYDEANTIFVTRIQFYAIEIARNRKGLNNSIRKSNK
ncbi:polysaccharide biosynthesis domain containing protein 1 [Chamberlinius hualienensis]